MPEKQSITRLQPQLLIFFFFNFETGSFYIDKPQFAFLLPQISNQLGLQACCHRSLLADWFGCCKHCELRKKKSNQFIHNPPNSCSLKHKLYFMYLEEISGRYRPVNKQQHRATRYPSDAALPCANFWSCLSLWVQNQTRSVSHHREKGFYSLSNIPLCLEQHTLTQTYTNHRLDVVNRYSCFHVFFVNSKFWEGHSDPHALGL